VAGLAFLNVNHTHSLTPPRPNALVAQSEERKRNGCLGERAGAGFWGISRGLNLSKSIDPAVVFMSIGFQHTFDDEQFGAHIQPGNTFNYGFGAGFSVNNLVAFSGRVSGSYQRETKIDKIEVAGTSSEPISFIGSMSYRLSNDTRLETTLDLGVSGDANDVGMGFSYIWNL